MGSQEVSVEQSGKEISSEKVPWWTSCRLLLCLMAFLAIFNVYSLRVNLNIAIVCMVNQTAVLPPGVWNMTEKQDSGKCGQTNVTTSHTMDGEFVWSKNLQGIILSSFFWGYMMTQILTGWLAVRYGGKRLLGFSMLVVAIATLLTPVGSRWSPYMLVFLQFVKGLGEGMTYPAMTDIWSRWAPPKERSTLIMITYTGAHCGLVVTLPLSGWLCEEGFAGGWPSIFYVSGMVCLVWFVLWMALVSDSPAQHPRISPIEKNYIQTSIGSPRPHTTTGPIPWRSILRSLPVWAIFVAHVCGDWVIYTLETNIPTYMSEVLKFDMKSNGIFSAIPNIAVWLLSTVAGILADKCFSKGMATKNVRKLLYSLGSIGPAIFFVAISYVSCEQSYVAVTLLTVAWGLSGLQDNASLINHVDIAPPFAGLLFGISNTLAAVSGILTPYTMGTITTDQTQEQWRTVFYISAAIPTFGAIVFGIFADGEVQEWAKPYMIQQDGEDNNDKHTGAHYNEAFDKGPTPKPEDSTSLSEYIPLLLVNDTLFISK